MQSNCPVLKHFLLILAKSLLVAFIFTLLTAVALTINTAGQELILKNKIYPNVYINGINFGRQTKSEVVNFFARRNKQLKTVTLTIKYEEDVATLSGAMIDLHYDGDTAAEQAFSIGHTSSIIARYYQKIATIYRLSRFDFNANLVYNRDPTNQYLDDLNSRYNRTAENALFQFESGRVTAFRADRQGLKVDTDKALIDISQAIKSYDEIPWRDRTIIVNTIPIKPAVALASINNFGIEEMIGKGQSDYSGSIPNRVHNVILAASQFNGVIIPKNATLSYNQTVGDISATTGYQQAYIIKNGQTVLGDGGGACQVSTTLFRAALDAGLPILERTAHAYRVHYYENDRKPGFDATVFAPQVDLKITNDTPAAILIQTEVDKAKKILTFTFFGKKDGRISTVSSSSIWDIRPAPEPKYQDDPTLKRGITKQVDWAAPGTKAKFHYKVERGGEILQDRNFLSNYRPWQAVYLVGTAD